MEPIEQSIVINRPIEEVFDVATCQERCKVWVGPIVATKKTSDGPVGVGSTYEHQEKFLGITIETKPVITAWEPPHKAVIENSAGPVSYVATYTFEATEQGTQMKTHFKAIPSWAIGHFPDRLVRNAIIRQFEGDLKSLKELLETETEIKV